MAPLYHLRRRLAHRLGRLREDAELRNRSRAWDRGPRAEQIRELDLEDWGSDSLTIADVDGDGKLELLWLQSQGIFASSLYLEGGRRPFLELGRGLTCLTATDVLGRQRWRYGTPYRGDLPYCSHASEGMVTVLEDAGGRPLVALLAAPDRLCILDGLTGTLLRETALPDDNFALLDRLRTPEGDRLLVSVNDLGRGSHAYGNPHLILDTRLDVVATFEALGAGHRRWIRDFDGDGADEALVGYELFDAEGRRRWCLDVWEGRIGEYDPVAQHLDGVAPCQVDGRWYAALAGSDRLYWIDDRGHALWTARPRHAQHAAAGRFQPRPDETVVLVIDSLKDTWAQCHSLDGTLRWRRRLIANWPLGIPNGARGRWMHMSVPAVQWRGGAPGDLLVVCEMGWPYALDADGEVAMVFDCPPSARKADLVLPFHRVDDFGFGYQARSADLDGDGEEELVIHDRRHAWLYRRPEIHR